MTQGRVTALVADDEPFARAGLKRMLAEFDWIDCIGEAASGTAAIEATAALRASGEARVLTRPSISPGAISAMLRPAWRGARRWAMNSRCHSPSGRPNAAVVE